MDLHPDKNGTSNTQSDGLNNNNGGNGVVEDGERVHSRKVPELTKLNSLETASSQSLFRTLHKILHDSIENKKEDGVSSVFKKLIQMIELNNQMISRRYKTYMHTKEWEILMASTQDFLTSSFLITRNDTFYVRVLFALMCCYMGDAMDPLDLPTLVTLEPVEL